MMDLVYFKRTKSNFKDVTTLIQTAKNKGIRLRFLYP
jgi:hypothetical protein